MYVCLILSLRDFFLCQLYERGERNILKEYIQTAFIFCALSGIILLLSCSRKNERIISFSSAILLFFVILTPLGNIRDSLKDFNISEHIDNFRGEYSNQEWNTEVEKGYKEGVLRLIRDKFGISETDMEIAVFGFDFDNIAATRVTIWLKNNAVYADYRAVLEFLNSQNIGIFRVEVFYG